MEHFIERRLGTNLPVTIYVCSALLKVWARSGRGLIRFTSVKRCQYATVGAARVVPVLIIATSHLHLPNGQAGR